MVKKSKKKYIESHWLIFGLQGVVALLFGWYVMFTGITDIPALIAVVGCTLLALGIVETFNLLHRKRMQYNWGLPLAIALIEIVVAILLLFTMKTQFLLICPRILYFMQNQNIYLSSVIS